MRAGDKGWNCPPGGGGVAAAVGVAVGVAGGVGVGVGDGDAVGVGVGDGVGDAVGAGVAGRSIHHAPRPCVQAMSLLAPASAVNEMASTLTFGSPTPSGTQTADAVVQFNVQTRAPASVPM